MSLYIKIYKSERDYHGVTTESYIDDLQGKPAGIFHKLPNYEHETIPHYGAKFGPDEQMVMHIKPDYDEYHEHIGTYAVDDEPHGPPPSTYSVEWLGAMPGSSSNLFDPKVKRQIFDALHNHGVKDFHYLTMGGPRYGARSHLFGKLRDEYRNLLEYLEYEKRTWGKSFSKIKNPLYIKISKATGQDERQRYFPTTAMYLRGLYGKAPGVFHLMEGYPDEYGVPNYAGTFGDDNKMVMHITPNVHQYHYHKQGGPPPISYYVAWLGAAPGSPSTLFDPRVKKQIYDALHRQGVRHFSYDPMGGDKQVARMKLFQKLQNEYASELERNNK